MTPRRWGLVHARRAAVKRHMRGRRHNPLAELPPAAPEGAAWTAEPWWVTGDFAPRDGNVLTPLIDGEQAMRAMYDAIASATRSVYLCAWFISPPMRMVRQDAAPPKREVLRRDAGAGWHPLPPHAPCGPETLGGLLAHKAGEVDVRILLWPGSRWGKFQARTVRAAQRALLEAHPQLLCRLDRRTKQWHCQHQKALVVDGRLAFVGGLDITDFDADRWDTQEHLWRLGLNWHDCHLQIEGPGVADVAQNFVDRWNGLTSHDVLPAPQVPSPRDGGVRAQIVRTLPRGIYPFARGGVYNVYHAYRQALTSAERFIYIETQYLWSPEITDLLSAVLRRPRRDPFIVVLVLPAHPNIGKANTDKHLRSLLQADGGRGVLRLYTLYTWTHVAQTANLAYQPIYVHAKVAIVDDVWCTVGSANLNGRGMATDSEINVITADRDVTRALRLGLWAEHLGVRAEEIAGDEPVALLRNRWRVAAHDNERRLMTRGAPLPCALMPYALGTMAADWGLGELEAALLDR